MAESGKLRLDRGGRGKSASEEMEPMIQEIMNIVDWKALRGWSEAQLRACLCHGAFPLNSQIFFLNSTDLRVTASRILSMSYS
jgi:hypothetical protein